MNTIKDTMPSTYDVVEGKVAFSFGLNLANPTQKDNFILLPIRPMFSLTVDQKLTGEYIVENVVEIKISDNVETIYKSAYGHITMTILEFNNLVRKNFKVPQTVNFKPPPYLDLRDYISNVINTTPLFPN